MSNHYVVFYVAKTHQGKTIHGKCLWSPHRGFHGNTVAHIITDRTLNFNEIENKLIELNLFESASVTNFVTITKEVYDAMKGDMQCV